MKVYTLFLSTLTPVGNIYAPYNKSNLANVKWTINWDSLFGINTVGKCRVKIRLISKGSNTYVFDNDIMTLNCPFSSNYSNNTNGVNVAWVTPINVPTVNTDHYLTADTTQMTGMSIDIPKGFQDFFIQFCNMDGSISTDVVDDYMIWFFFEVDEDE